eukprot:15141794-Alexandrium_andersonii.AAC.1
MNLGGSHSLGGAGPAKGITRGLLRPGFPGGIARGDDDPTPCHRVLLHCTACQAVSHVAIDICPHTADCQANKPLHLRTCAPGPADCRVGQEQRGRQCCAGQGLVRHCKPPLVLIFARQLSYGSKR